MGTIQLGRQETSRFFFILHLLVQSPQCTRSSPRLLHPVGIILLSPQWRRLTAFVPPQVVTPGALQLHRDLMQAVVSKIILRPCAILPLKCPYCAFVLYQTAI